MHASSSSRTRRRRSPIACRASSRWSTTPSSARRAQRVERVRAIARDIAHALSASIRWTLRPRRAARQGRPAHRHGRRVPRTAGRDGRLLRAPRRRARGGRAGDRRALPAALRRRRAARDCETGTVLALADKLETLAGLFGIGQQPTGDKDPFALRRHALGVMRMLIEQAARAAARPPGRRSRSAPSAGHVAQRVRRADRVLPRPAARLPARARRLRAPRSTRSSRSRPTRLWLVPAQLEAVRTLLRAARSGEPGGGEQAHRQHPAQVRRRRRRRRSTPRCCPSRPSARCTSDRVPGAAGRARRWQARDFTGALTVLAGARERGRPLLRQRDGDGRRRTRARQPAGAAGQAARDDEPGRRPVETVATRETDHPRPRRRHQRGQRRLHQESGRVACRCRAASTRSRACARPATGSRSRPTSRASPAGCSTCPR